MAKSGGPPAATRRLPRYGLPWVPASISSTSPPAMATGRRNRWSGPLSTANFPPGSWCRPSAASATRTQPRSFRLLEQSLTESLARMKLERVDVFFLHNLIIPNQSSERYQGTTRDRFTGSVRPALQRLVSQGRVGAWGITGIGVPESVLETVAEDPAAPGHSGDRQPVWTPPEL